MKIVVILNGVSRKKHFFYTKILPVLRNSFAIEVLETQYPNHAKELAAQAAKQKTDVVLAAGGDGTLHQTLNGLYTSGTEVLPSLGIIPLGTGNDFAKLCGAKSDAHLLADQLRRKPLSTDVGKISCVNAQGEPVTEYFINVCSVGMGPEVVRRLQSSSRLWGAGITYVQAIVATFFTHRPHPLNIDAYDWKWRGKARVLAVANGKSFGNSIYIAPDARPDDGIFSTFLAGDLKLLKFLYCLQRIKSKKKVRDNRVFYNTCTSVNLTSEVPTFIEADGELAGMLPAKIELLPGAINFLR